MRTRMFLAFALAGLLAASACPLFGEDDSGEGTDEGPSEQQGGASPFGTDRRVGDTRSSGRPEIAIVPLHSDRFLFASTTSATMTIQFEASHDPAVVATIPDAWYRNGGICLTRLGEYRYATLWEGRARSEGDHSLHLGLLDVHDDIVVREVRRLDRRDPVVDCVADAGGGLYLLVDKALLYSDDLSGFQEVVRWTYSNQPRDLVSLGAEVLVASVEDYDVVLRSASSGTVQARTVLWTNRENYPRRIRLASDTQGRRIVALWEMPGKAQNRSSFWFAEVTRDGRLVGDPVVLGAMQFTAFDVALAVDDRGTVHVLYAPNDGNWWTPLLYHRLDDDGSLTEAVRVDDEGDVRHVLRIEAVTSGNRLGVLFTKGYTATDSYHTYYDFLDLPAR